jgi:hypothetical protein
VPLFSVVAAGKLEDVHIGMTEDRIVLEILQDQA